MDALFNIVFNTNSKIKQLISLFKMFWHKKFAEAHKIGTQKKQRFGDKSLQTKTSLSKLESYFIK